MKVVILCGGLGTRLREETEFRPKPMVNIGSHPILRHIMKYYSCFGFSALSIMLSGQLCVLSIPAASQDAKAEEV